MIRCVLALLLVGCHTPSMTPDPPTAAASALPLPTSIGTAPLASAPPPAVDAAATVPSLYGQELEAWLKKNDVKPPKDLDMWGSCDVVRANVLFCKGAPSESLSTGESVFPLRVVYARSGLALMTPIEAGPLDNPVEPGQNASDFQYIILDASLDAAGTALTISDHPGKTCEKVLAQYKLPEEAGLRRMVQKACTARGRYVLQNGKLVRAP